MKWQILFNYEIPFNDEQKNILLETDKFIKYKDGSVYHKDNKLNDLTNKEWIKFQKSWFVLNPKPRPENVKLHPAKFPEELVQSFIEFFTKKGQTVLDPMVGTGSTLIACALCGRNGIGIELLKKYALITKQRIEKIVANRQLFDEQQKIKLTLILGDARDIDKMNLPRIDYCITSPPYWNMLKEKGFETQKKRKEKGLDVYYSDDPRDLGNIDDYNKFLSELVQIYKKVYDLLKPNGYFTVIIKNIKKRGKVYPLAWDLAKELSKFFTLKDEKIWCQNDIKLAPYGYRNAWVSNVVHHYCLNFRKEKKKLEK
ncbi:MAG: DNA methyltransferase [Candidatus Micrarchaeia archaeon]